MNKGGCQKHAVAFGEIPGGATGGGNTLWQLPLFCHQLGAGAKATGSRGVSFPNDDRVPHLLMVGGVGCWWFRAEPQQQPPLGRSAAAELGARCCTPG